MSAVHLLVTSGEGPRECRLAARHVAARIAREGSREGIGVDVTPDDGEPHSLLVTLRGKGADALARAWEGGVQWICRSPFRPHHKRRNWFVAVHAVDMPALGIELKEDDVTFETFRAGGPGGQHQNTTDSAVRATHVSGLTAVAREERSQHRNRALALERLRAQAFLTGEAARDAATSARHVHHKTLERGNARRVFEGTAFKEKR